MMNPLQRNQMPLSPLAPKSASAPSAPPKETVTEAPADSIFLNFKTFTQEPPKPAVAPLPGKPKPEPKVVRQEIELKNGLLLVEDTANKVVQVHQKSAGGAPTLLMQFEDTHIEQPNRNHSGLMIKNSEMEQHIPLDGKNTVIKDLAGAAHVLPNKMPAGYSAHKWLSDTYTLTPTGVSGTQVQYETMKGQRLPARPRGAGFDIPVAAQGKFQPVRVAERDGQLEVNSFRGWERKNLQTFVTREQLFGN